MKNRLTAALHGSFSKARSWVYGEDKRKERMEGKENERRKEMITGAKTCTPTLGCKRVSEQCYNITTTDRMSNTMQHQRQAHLRASSVWRSVVCRRRTEAAARHSQPTRQAGDETAHSTDLTSVMTHAHTRCSSTDCCNNISSKNSSP